MNRTAYGSFTHPDDPGEPATGAPRISVTEDEADLLRFLADNRNVLEIGTGLGVSTRALSDTAWDVVTIDNDPWVWEHVWPTVNKYGNVTCLKERDQTDEYSMVFIDGEHKTLDTRDDIDYAHKVCPRGMIVVHDAHMDTVKEALGFYDGFHTIDTHHGLAIKFVGWT